MRSERDAFSQQIEQIQTETSDYERSIHELKQEIQQVQSAAPGQVVHSDLREDVEQIRRDYEQVNTIICRSINGAAPAVFKSIS